MWTPFIWKSTVLLVSLWKGVKSPIKLKYLLLVNIFFRYCSFAWDGDRGCLESWICFSLFHTILWIHCQTKTWQKFPSTLSPHTLVKSPRQISLFPSFQSESVCLRKYSPNTQETNSCNHLTFILRGVLSKWEAKGLVGAQGTHSP